MNTGEVTEEQHSRETTCGVLKGPYPLLIGLGLSLLLLGGVFIVQHIHHDEGIWSYIGRVWIDFDMVPYRESFENKPPFIIHLFTLGYRLFGANFQFTRLMGFLALIGTAFIVRVIAGRTGGAAAGNLGFLLTVLFRLQPFFDELSHPETFQGLFVGLAFLMLLHRLDPQAPVGWLNDLLAGIFLGIALTIKQTAMLSVILWLAVRFIVFREGLSRDITRLGMIVAMLIMLHAVALFPMWAGGMTPGQYIDAAYVSLFDGSGYDYTRLTLFDRVDDLIDLASQNPQFFSFLLLVIVSLAFSGYLPSRTRFVLVGWLGVELLQSLMGGTYFRHHFHAVLPPACIIMGILLGRAIGRLETTGLLRPSREWIPLLLLVGLLFPISQYRVMKDLAITVRTGQYPDYDRELIAWVGKHSEKDDGVVYYGKNWSDWLALSDRRIPMRMMVIHFLGCETRVKEYTTGFENDPPEFVLFDRDRPQYYLFLLGTWLDDMLAREYIYITTINGVDIYRRKHIEEMIV